MKRITAVLSSFALLAALTGCAKSPEELAFDEKIRVAELIYAERSTWDLLGTVNVTSCLARTIGDVPFMLWSSQTAKCNNDIKSVISVVSRLDPEIQTAKSQEVLFVTTRSQFSAVKSIQLCDQLEWFIDAKKQGCVDQLLNASTLTKLKATIDTWYEFRSNPTK